MQRRRFPGAVALTRGDGGQGDLFRADVEPGTGMWEFAALATSLDLVVCSRSRLRRDRADLKNALDKVRSRWGRGDSTARDQKSCISASCKVRRS